MSESVGGTRRDAPIRSAAMREQLPNYAAERIVECYYSFAPSPGLWTSAGYPFIAHPACNADRGPVSIRSLRMHLEY
jgi:high affinity Mn2+ porin